MQNKIIEFIRIRDYELVKELGQGACGKTVLLHDDMIDEHFVCKKYCPFSETHRQELYSNFADQIAAHITKIENGTKYNDDFNRIQNELEDAYRSFMLEETAPDSALITRCFINGSYYYNKAGFSVWVVREFLRLFKSASQEKKRIIMANLHTRLDALPRYDHSPKDDDIPF